MPLVHWLDDLPPRARDKCLVRLERLEELGHELRRPEADYLRDDGYELRAKHQRMNYRMLYFFHGREAVVVSHGFAKQQAAVPVIEIEHAIRRMRSFRADPRRHAFETSEKGEEG